MLGRVVSAEENSTTPFLPVGVVRGDRGINLAQNHQGPGEGKLRLKPGMGSPSGIRGIALKCERLLQPNWLHTYRLVVPVGLAREVERVAQSLGNSAFS